MNHNFKFICCSLLAAGLLAGCACGRHQDQAALQAQAKISQADAQKTALDQVPGGTVKTSELEKEKGKLMWSFDITTPGTSEVTEVEIDAITGKLIAVEKESAEKKEKSK